MNRVGFQNASMFIGPEVEHTPAFSKRTLFVVGKQKLDQIERMAKEYKTPHIFMGANHSFNSASEDPYWDTVITQLLDKGYWVTLDYQAHEHETVLKMLNPGVWQCRLFVPLLGVRIPKVQTSSVNLTVKIDDIDFAATNPGVWCLHHHEITDSNRFTDWQEYSTDEVLEPLAGPAEILPVKTQVPNVEVSTDIGDPELNLEKTKEVIETSVEITEIKNDPTVGLDTESISMLKPDDMEDITPTTPKVDVETAAAAYAEGAESTKRKGKK